MLRITVRTMEDGSPGTSVGVSNLAVPDITPERTLDVPTTGTPDALVFTASPGYRSGCLTVSDRAGL